MSSSGHNSPVTKPKPPDKFELAAMEEYASWFGLNPEDIFPNYQTLNMNEQSAAIGSNTIPNKIIV